MAKDKEYYFSRISVILETYCLFARNVFLDDYCAAKRHVDFLKIGYIEYGIDWLLDVLSEEMACGYYYVPVCAWDRIIDYDYLSHHC